MQLKTVRKIMNFTLKSLVTDDGINASAKNEVYGCIFGRDSAITILKILSAHEKEPNQELLEVCKKTIFTLIKLQGKKQNIENGEEFGKFIHEYRKEKYQHLTSGDFPWFLDPDKTLKNYDSIDATPLGLIAIYRYFEKTRDKEFARDVETPVKDALNWLILDADNNKDNFVDYMFHPTRKFGGLKVQSWTDSQESIQNTEGTFPKYPIAPVEAQAYAWLAAKLWADYFKNKDHELSKKLSRFSKIIKIEFNRRFLIKDSGLYFFAQALDGHQNQVKTITANPLLALWASYQKNGKQESIIDEKYLEDIVKRTFKKDMFSTHAGIRTMSNLSQTFNPNPDSYHNGSFWPFLNGLIWEGLVNFGFTKEAKRLKEATLKPIKHFKTPIELYTLAKDNTYREYENEKGQKGCREQAWSAAAILDLAYN